MNAVEEMGIRAGDKFTLLDEMEKPLTIQGKEVGVSEFRLFSESDGTFAFREVDSNKLFTVRMGTFIMVPQQ